MMKITGSSVCKTLLILLLPFTLKSQIKQIIRPDSLPPVAKTYSQAIVSSGAGTIYIAGQVSVDSKGHLIGEGDFKKQAEQVFENLRYVLKSSGASMEDLVKLNYYIVDLDSTRLRIFREVAARNIILSSPPVSTLAGVQSLYDKRIWVEIDGIAVKPDQKNKQ
jgi:2-iminobutanoate/2-iminopropanoate deaminase